MQFFLQTSTKLQLCECLEYQALIICRFPFLWVDTFPVTKAARGMETWNKFVEYDLMFL